MIAKRTFVLLRGLGRESRHWGKFYTLLQQQEFCSKIILCDLPGAGIFHKEPGRPSVAKMLEEIARRYESELEENKPLSIVGFSLGGMIALEYLYKSPELFSEFFLINSSIGNLSPFYKRMRPSALSTLLKIAKSKDLSKKEQLILELTSRHFANDSELLKSHVHIAETAPMSFNVLSQQVLAAARYSGPGRLIKKKGLVLYSKQDDLVHPSCSLELARLLSVKAVGHETAGHDLALDDPQWVIDRFKDFFKNME